MNEAQLKACPFCGQLPATELCLEQPMIFCKNFKCQASLHVRGESAGEAINNWNTRAGDREPEAVQNAGNIAGSISANGCAAPVNILEAIIEEARNKHHDILTEESWNPNYTLEISLKVKELRELAGWLKQHNDQAQR